MKIVTVVPGPKNSDGVHAARGTKVMLEDGSELKRVTDVVLRASVGGVWEATITVLLEQAPTITARDVSLPEAATDSVANTP